MERLAAQKQDRLESGAPHALAFTRGPRWFELKLAAGWLPKSRTAGERGSGRPDVASVYRVACHAAAALRQLLLRWRRWLQKRLSMLAVVALPQLLLLVRGHG